MSHIDPRSRQYQQALARFDRGYAAFLALIDDFPEARRGQVGACGTWTPREILAHLSGWLTEAIQRFEAFQAGDITRVQYDWQDDYAGFNRVSLAARAGLSWDETVAELRSRVGELYQRAQAVDPEDAAADLRYGEWLDALWKDCIEHLGQLCRFVVA
jgi:hypothetical protein